MGSDALIAPSMFFHFCCSVCTRSDHIDTVCSLPIAGACAGFFTGAVDDVGLIGGYSPLYGSEGSGSLHFIKTGVSRGGGGGRSPLV